MTILEDNTLDMLFQSSVCWWNPLHIHECSMLMFLGVRECTCSVTSSGNEFVVDPELLNFELPRANCCSIL